MASLPDSTSVRRNRQCKIGLHKKNTVKDIGHVTWDPNTGFDLNNLDPELKNLFDMCGISEAQLKDRETSKVIYDFIEKKGGMEAVKNELRRQAPPPSSGSSRPPPPPTVRLAKRAQIPPASPPQRSSAPPTPPSYRAPPHPPPPPPPSSRGVQDKSS
ncbi:hypothetical protein PAMP_020305 [Pampus punctatissimus]